MSPVSGPIIQVDRSFDPRHLSDLELWLADFTLPTLPGGTTLASSDTWPGAPAIPGYPGSPRDGGIWDTNPASKVFIVDQNAKGDDALFFWRSGHRGLSIQDRYLRLTTAGTLTPAPISLPGPCTFVFVVRNTNGDTQEMMDDEQSNPDDSIRISSDRIRINVDNIEADISGDAPFEDMDTGAVHLVIATRNAADLWRVWIDGTENSNGQTVAGTMTLKTVAQTFSGFTIELADVLVYSGDWTSRVADLNAYFASQYGVP